MAVKWNSWLTYPLRTPRTKLSMKNDPTTISGMKKTQLNTLPRASLVWNITIHLIFIKNKKSIFKTQICIVLYSIILYLFLVFKQVLDRYKALKSLISIINLQSFQTLIQNLLGHPLGVTKKPYPVKNRRPAFHGDTL